MEELRLDMYLVSKQILPSRERAKQAIKSKEIFVNNKCITKPSFIVLSEKDEVEYIGCAEKYVGRGAYKLLEAIEKFNIDLKNKVCLDIGASTGGFVQVMLEKEVKQVYALDVGHNQLAEKLKNDERVVNMEGVNIRYVIKEEFEEPIEFISADVSFISLKLILPKIYELLEINGTSVCLIKPQFEVGKNNLDKKGIVRDKKLYQKIINNIKDICENELNFKVISIIQSPIKGGDGNTEFLIYLSKE